MRSFREVLKNNNLFDLGFKGSPFRFSNRRMGSHEYKARLEKVLATGSWRDIFPKAKVEHVATMTSDHYLVDFLDICFTIVSNK